MMTNAAKNIIALIPARSNSKRIPCKNVRELGGHPLLAYAIASALESGIFTRVVVSTNSAEIAETARRYGAETPFLRPEEYARDLSPDIEWVRHALSFLAREGALPAYYALLRPTNPFRQARTIQRAWDMLCSHPEADTLRAVEKCHEHPYKMWRIESGLLVPLHPAPASEQTPYHSRPYQSLPEIYVQNASLEMAPCACPLRDGRIAGERILAFVTEGHEGFDLNFPEDWIVAEHFVANGLAELPGVRESGS